MSEVVEVESRVFLDEATHEAAQRVAAQRQTSIAYLVREAVVFGGVNPQVQSEKLPKSRPVKVKFRWTPTRHEAVRQMSHQASISASAWVYRAVRAFVAALESPDSKASAERLGRYQEWKAEAIAAV